MGQTVFPSSADALIELPQAVVSLRKTYDDGYVSRAHRHRRHQLLYSVSGLTLVAAEETQWAVPSGVGLLIPAGVVHDNRMIGRVEMQTLYIAPERLAAEGFARCRMVGISDLMASLIGAFAGLENQQPISPKAEHLAQLILLELADAEETELALPLPKDARLRRVCEALSAHPDRLRGVDDWAYFAGLSRRSFTRIFVRETGMSFGEWRQRLLCHRAMEALARGGDIGRVAHGLGYANRYTLEAMMRRYVPRSGYP